jgi:septal ring factor EnvC (AmiA/AmiB activator)
MNTIEITVKGTEFEDIAVTLSSHEVASYYTRCKEQLEQIADLKKKLESSENQQKWSREARERADSEISQANILLNALGVQERVDENQYSAVLPLSTRIALYLAKGGK